MSVRLLFLFLECAINLECVINLECALVISEEAFRMEGETSKIKKLASVERLNLNMSDPMNANLSSIFIMFFYILKKFNYFHIH